jgi:phage anti-repressor protein
LATGSAAPFFCCPKTPNNLFMNELIKITTNSQGGDVVSARELHQFLEVQTKFNDWINRMFEYGLTENIDYVAITQKRVTAQGNETTFTDYALTIDCVKHISMLQRTDKGKQARQYFIDRDNQLRKIELTQKDYILKKLQEFEDFKKDILSGKTGNYLIKKNKALKVSEENSNLSLYLEKYLVEVPKEKKEGLTCTEIANQITAITGHNFSLKILGGQLSQRFNKLQINRKGITRQIYFVAFNQLALC